MPLFGEKFKGMDQSPEIRVGGCRCGAIRYVVQGPPLGGIACHCRDCQYAAGGSFNLSWIFHSSGFSVSNGEPKVFKAGKYSGGSSFCANCGVQIFSRPDSNPNLVAIKVGSLDDASGFQIDAYMWMSSAPDWHQLHDGAAQYQKNIPSSQ